MTQGAKPYTARQALHDKLTEMAYALPLDAEISRQPLSYWQNATPQELPRSATIQDAVAEQLREASIKSTAAETGYSHKQVRQAFEQQRAQQQQAHRSAKSGTNWPWLKR